MFKQIVALTLNNLKSTPSRIGPAVVMVIGVSSVTGVITAMLALAAGLEETFLKSGRDDRVVILSEQARFVGQSNLNNDQVSAIIQAPGIAKTASGEPAASKDARISVFLRGKNDDVLRAIVVRGLSPVGLEIRSEIRLIEGRMFRPGLHEAVVGRDAQLQFLNTDIGDRLRLETVNMQIVGVFESDDWFESGFITDADTLLGAYSKTSTNAVVAQLESVASLGDLQGALSDHPALQFQVLRESEYYERLNEEFSLLDRIASLVGVIIGVGGFLCVLNVMDALVSARKVEITTFRALGFTDSNVAISLVMESLLIAFFAAFIGVAITWALFDGNLVTTGSFNTSVVHQVVVSADVVVLALFWAGVMAICGAVIPAMRATRRSAIPVARPL